ncbi:unnamed protein product [Pipistrellus nathusii]|uniref:Uncharacterized protein n=1 Tax=Pipistrellus nathusii TaxID=59473 RepID=A0ABN9ZRE2_PIPNA
MCQLPNPPLNQPTGMQGEITKVQSMLTASYHLRNWTLALTQPIGISHIMALASPHHPTPSPIKFLSFGNSGLFASCRCVGRGGETRLGLEKRLFVFASDSVPWWSLGILKSGHNSWTLSLCLHVPTTSQSPVDND